MGTSRLVEHTLHNTMLSRRFQGLVLMALVFVTVIIVLTVIQAIKHDWFIYSAFSDTVSGTVKETEWGMVGLGVILGAGFALGVGFICHLLSEYWYRGQTPRVSGYSTDIETGKEKFLAAHHSPTERDYVARYGQKAYRTVSGGEASSMPQPLTPGHTATVKIKALTEQEAAAPGRGWSLGRLLSFSWDPAAKIQASQQLEHAVPSRLGTVNLPKTQSSSSSIEPVNEDRTPATRSLTFSEMAHQISSPFGFLRAGSAHPVAHDTPYETDGEAPSEPHAHHQVEGMQVGSPRKGAGLMTHVYTRKLEQAQQMQAAKTRLGAVDSASEGQIGPSPRILVLRESGDIQVDVELGDRENTPDGSFARATTHRRSSSSGTSEGEEEMLPVSNIRVPSPTSASGKAELATLNLKDGHAPEVVPADGDSRPAVAKPGRRAVKHSKSQSKSQGTEPARTSNAAVSSESQVREQSAADSHRQSTSPVFLSPATSLNSNSSHGSKNDGLSQQAHNRESDSHADATVTGSAASNPVTHPVKASGPAASAVRQNIAADGTAAMAKTNGTTGARLSSAALQAMEGGRGSKGAKTGSRASAKSHSRSSSVAASEWADVELQSEAEEEGHNEEGQQGRSVRQSGPPPARARAAVETAASAAGDYFESDNESELGIEGEEHGQQAEHSVVLAQGSGSGSPRSVLKVVPVTALPKDAASVKMVVCVSLEEILPRPKAGLLSRMLRLADVSVVASQDSHEPVYLLHPGGEYHLGVSLFHPPSGQRVQVQGVAWVRVAVADGRPITLDMEQDQDVEGGDWSGRATWLTTQHESQALATALPEGHQEQAPVVSLNVTIGFKCIESAGKTPKKGRKHRSHSHVQDLVLSTTMAARIVTRRTDAQASLGSSEEYSPPAQLCDLWQKWDNTLEDIQDCTVICTK